MEATAVRRGPGRGRRWLFTAMFLGLQGAVLLAGLELISRWALPPDPTIKPATGEVDFDPELGWRGHRGFRAEVQHGRHPVRIPVSINSDGFRDQPWDEKLRRAESRGARKILVVGDSLIYGWANPAEDRLTEQLQARYLLAGQPAEVFNAAMPAYGPNHQFRMLPELLARLRPHEVVVVFCINDFGDAALPYDYRSAFRVYQPFYDQNGELVLNRRVPRRPSLLVRGTALEQLRLFRALDHLTYLWQDRAYAKYGVPNARTAPIARLDELFGSAELRARFSYIETTVLALYTRMAELCRNSGARLTFLPSVWAVGPPTQMIDDLLRTPLESRGVSYMSCPREIERFYPWESSLLDGHPNLLWAWIMADALHARLEGARQAFSLEGLPQAAGLQAALEPGNDTQSGRWLAMEWQPAEPGGRRVGFRASCLLRNPPPGPARLFVRGSAVRAMELIVSTVDYREVCRVKLGPELSESSCAFDTREPGPVAFVFFTPPEGEAPLLQSVRLEGGQQRAR